MRHLPNALSISRMIVGVSLCPLIDFEQWTIAWWLFLAAALSDLVDGPLARRLKVTSEYGDRLDKWGDVALLTGTAVGLTLADVIPVTMLLVSVASFAMGRYFAHVGPASQDGLSELWAMGAIALVTLEMGMGGIIVSHAYGWHWWYIGVAAAIALAISVFHRDRLRIIGMKK